MKSPARTSRGPFKAFQLSSGDRYELSDGHPIECLPSGGRHSGAGGLGFTVLRSDPDVDSAGVDTGFSPSPETLRAPDVAVGNVPNEPGWVDGVPPLAVEYADTGQDEDDLQLKVSELLDAGTRFVWVVRLTGPRRIEVHRAGETMHLAHPGEVLEAPGVLRNPVPVEALYDWEAGRQVTLRNLLQSEGYRDLDDVRERSAREGIQQGVQQGELATLRAAILDVLAERELDAGDELPAALEACADADRLRRLLRTAVRADGPAELLAALAP